MRVMAMVKATADTEAGAMPEPEMLVAMGKFNEELVKAGVLLAGEGLHPSAKGARVVFDGESRTVVDGPFAGSKELVAGFWILQVTSMEEAVEWMKRAPNPTSPHGVIEIRPIFEAEDFGALQEQVPEVFEAERRMRAAAAEKAAGK